MFFICLHFLFRMDGTLWDKIYSSPHLVPCWGPKSCSKGSRCRLLHCLRTMSSSYRIVIGYTLFTLMEGDVIFKEGCSRLYTIGEMSLSKEGIITFAPTIFKGGCSRLYMVLRWYHTVRCPGEAGETIKRGWDQLIGYACLVIIVFPSRGFNYLCYICIRLVNLWFSFFYNMLKWEEIIIKINYMKFGSIHMIMWKKIFLMNI